MPKTPAAAGVWEQKIEPKAVSILTLPVPPAQALQAQWRRTPLTKRRAPHHSISNLEINNSSSLVNSSVGMNAHGFLSTQRRRKPPRSVPCAHESCANEAVHIVSTGIGFCLSHFWAEED